MLLEKDLIAERTRISRREARCKKKSGHSVQLEMKSFDLPMFVLNTRNDKVILWVAYLS